MHSKTFYHLIAILIVAVWGLTFISTKVLMNNGLAPQEIFLIRFTIAYLGIWFISPRRLFADSWKDELWLLLAGVTGGSLYFLSENVALGITLTTNVSFIVCTCPLLTTILALMIGNVGTHSGASYGRTNSKGGSRTKLCFRRPRGYSLGLGRTRVRPYEHCEDVSLQKETASLRLILGSLLALVGVALVVYNGSFVLKISPLGDCLALMAALCWAFYSLIIRRLQTRYGSVFITRKVFFYGILTIFPAFLVRPWQFPAEGFLQPAVWLNLIFLGFVASLVCFVVWNIVLKQLGTITASNYIYLNPLFTLAGSAFLLGEPLTWVALVGIILILAGVYFSLSLNNTWAGKKQKNSPR